jgi:hypothetical protein
LYNNVNVLNTMNYALKMDKVVIFMYIF